ncbi:MAG: pseudouridine synthase [Gammaproteobacteria bacterium]|nr:MAG: pseudouridine synthase [Gammaproteobacteria bacterium]
MRLDKFIGNNSELSRTQIHIAIKQGLVSVNGDIVSKTNLHIRDEDKIICNQQLIETRQPRYLMLHKPAGYVSANSDSEYPTALDLITLPFKKDLQIVGRLDVDTTGLLLLTDDGQWNHKVTSPKNNHTKSYLVTTAGPIPESAKQIFAEGILLKGETKATFPAELTILESHKARLCICEGKYHQVKRMFAALGNRVIELHRERIGAVHLDADLLPGKSRALTAGEIASFETYD